MLITNMSNFTATQGTLEPLISKEEPKATIGSLLCLMTSIGLIILLSQHSWPGQ